MEDKDKLIDAIKHTGFILENDICNLLEKNKWNVISNRYYIDHENSVEREIDIIAYKVKIIDDVSYYTALIISCKKSTKDSWAFLTKDVNHNDPNMNLWPVFNSTNSKILNFMLDKNINISEIVKKECETNLSVDFLHKTHGLDASVFAVQQIEEQKNKYKATNDCNIYNSIISTIKALNYEKESVIRKDQNVFYNFNLITVFDGKMLKYYFKHDDVSLNEIDEIKYLNRHIINKNEDFYRVQFIKATRFQDYIKYYNSLHIWNCKKYASILEDYYKRCILLKGGLDLFEKEIISYLSWYVYWCSSKYYNSQDAETVKIEYLNYNNEKSALKLSLNVCDEKLVNYLNENNELKSKVSEVLKKYYKYSGEFYFEDGLPF